MLARPLKRSLRLARAVSGSVRSLSHGIGKTTEFARDEPARTGPLRIGVFKGDGTGPEVTDEALKVLAEVAKIDGVQYTTNELPFSNASQRFLDTGVILKDEEVDDLRKNYDCVLMGAIGDPRCPPGVIEKGILLKLRFDLDQYINLRPVHLFEGVTTPIKGKGPAEINFDIVRENTEDLYCGNGGIVRRGTAQEVATQEMVATRYGVERVVRFAFDFARKKKAAGLGRGHLTHVNKTNVLTYCGDLWDRTFKEVAAEYPEITTDYNHIDAACMWMVKNPEWFDTVVVPNMFGDIITDIAAMIQGGLGVAAGGNINPTPGGTSMYEPMGGSAPKYTGKGVINPMAAIASMSMMLSQARSHRDRTEIAPRPFAIRSVHTRHAPTARQCVLARFASQRHVARRRTRRRGTRRRARASSARCARWRPHSTRWTRAGWAPAPLRSATASPPRCMTFDAVVDHG